jgi:hypothetical protein
MGEHDEQRLELLALIGAEGAVPTPAGNRPLWETLEREWASAQGAPWRLTLAMWVGVEPSTIVAAMCACIRAGLSGQSAPAVARIVEQLEAWLEDRADAQALIALEGEAQELAKQLADGAWDQAGEASHGAPWAIVYWAWAVEAAVGYAAHTAAGPRGDIHWGTIKVFASAVAPDEDAGDTDARYDACAAAVRTRLPELPQPTLFADDAPRSPQDTGSSHVEVGFDAEAAWAQAARCWRALRPARAIRDDVRDGASLWEVVVGGVPTSEQLARDTLLSLDQCEIATREARRLAGNTGRLEFEPLAAPYGGVAPITWFAEAFGLRVLAVSE